LDGANDCMSRETVILSSGAKIEMWFHSDLVVITHSNGKMATGTIEEFEDALRHIEWERKIEQYWKEEGNCLDDGGSIYADE